MSQTRISQTISNFPKHKTKICTYMLSFWEVLGRSSASCGVNLSQRLGRNARERERKDETFVRAYWSASYSPRADQPAACRCRSTVLSVNPQQILLQRCKGCGFVTLGAGAVVYSGDTPQRNIRSEQRQETEISRNPAKHGLI